MSMPSQPATSSNTSTASSSSVLTAGADENAKSMRLINDAISKSQNEFASSFNTLARELHKLFPEKHHGVAEIVRRLDQSLLEMPSLRQYYASKVGAIAAQEVTRGGRLTPEHGSVYVLPGLKVERLLFDQDFKSAAQDATQQELRRNVAARNIRATEIIVKHLAPICIYSEMLVAIDSAKEFDINVFGSIILRHHNMMKSWNERAERKERVLSVENLTENCSKMAIGKQSETPFANKKQGVNPMMVTMIRFLIMQSGTAFFDTANVNEMLDKATDETIMEAGEYLEDFLITVGVQRYLDAGEPLANIATYRKFRVSFIPADPQEFERERKDALGREREVTSTVRKVPIVYFKIAVGEEATWQGKPGYSVRQTPEGPTVIMSVSGPAELEELMKTPGRNFGYIPVPMPVIHYSIDNPEELTDETIRALEAQTRNVKIAYSPKDPERFKKELEASAISKEVMVMVMQHIRRLPREADAVSRLVNTYNTLNERFQNEPRYKDFSLKDVFVAILIYARTQPWVASNPKLIAVVERIQMFSAKPRPEISKEEEERIRNDPTYRKPVDMEEMDEMKAIVMMILDASGNNQEHHTQLIDRVFKCYIEYCQDPTKLNPDEIAGIYKMATAEGFFNMEMVDMVFTAAAQDGTATETAQVVSSSSSSSVAPVVRQS